MLVKCIDVRESSNKQQNNFPLLKEYKYIYN